jgi:hypothetical protein
VVGLAYVVDCTYPIATRVQEVEAKIVLPIWDGGRVKLKGGDGAFIIMDIVRRVWIYGVRNRPRFPSATRIDAIWAAVCKDAAFAKVPPVQLGVKDREMMPLTVMGLPEVVGAVHTGSRSRWLSLSRTGEAIYRATSWRTCVSFHTSVARVSALIVDSARLLLQAQISVF